jgi:hypothetical protein
MKLSARVLGLALAAGAMLAVSHHAMAQLPQPEGGPVKPIVEPTPTMTFGEMEHDFGKIFENKAVEYDFHFENKGAGKLTISSLKGSCGCTVPDLEKKEYQPGEGNNVHVRYDPHGKSGKQHQTVTIISNDPEHPTLQLQISAEVKPLVAMEPRLINFGQLQKGQGGSQKLLLTGRTADFAASNPTMMNGPDRYDIKVGETKEVDVDGEKLRQTEITVELKKNAPVGQLQDTLTVRTNDDRMAVVNVPIAGTIDGELELMPPRLALGLLKTKETFERDVKVTRKNGQPFKILAVANKSTNLTKLESSFTPDGAGYIIKVKGTGPEATGVLRADMVVTTDVPGEETVEIQVYGTFRADQ